MKIKFDVTPTEFIIIKDILKKYLTKDCKAYVFGSRAKSSSLHGSDLDLALECKEEIEFKKLSKIKIDFEDSRLPYMVDVIDLQAVKGYFKDMIEKEIIEFPLGKLERVPELRFKEFSGEWEEKKLGDIAIFLKGKGISKSDIIKDGHLKCIRYGELYTIYNEVINHIKSKTNLKEDDLVLSKYNDVIIPASGETQIDIATASCVLIDDVALSGDLNIIRTQENGVFLAYYLNNTKKIDIARLSQGISVVHLYSSQLKLLKLNLPQKQEQQKIASFLTTVDKKIEQLTKKVELQKQYKKGVMGKIFKQEIRFKNDDGSEFEEWEEKSLDDILILTLRELPKPKNNYLAIGIRSHCKGTFQKPNSEPHKIAMEKLYQVKENDLIVSITFAWESAIAIVKKSDEGGLVSHRFPTYTFNDNLKVDFFKYVIIQKKFRFMLDLISPGGAGRNRVMSKKEFLKLKLMIPSLKEQTKIANFLSSLDKKIDSTKEQLAKTKEFKKGLLQNMFV